MKRKTIKQLEAELTYSREVNDELRKQVTIKQQAYDKLKYDTMHDERKNLVKSYGQLLDVVSTSLRVLITPNTF